MNYGIGGGMGPPPPGLPPIVDLSSPQQRLQTEIGTLQAMTGTMLEALEVFCSQGGGGRAEQTTVDEVCELFSLVISVLQSDPDVNRLRVLLFESTHGGYPDIFTVLLKYLSARIVYSPGKVTPEDIRTSFNKLRTTALRTLTKVISIASHDHYPGSNDTAHVAALAAKSIVESNGVELLLAIVCGGPQVTEEAKISAIECLFVFIMTNTAGKQATISTKGGLQFLSMALRTEPSPTVRNYAAACIRELANTHPLHIINSEFPEAVVDLVRTDSSADVRVLITEMMDVLIKADTTYIQRYPLKKELSELLLNLLSHDTNTEVAGITCRLLSTIFIVEGKQISAINHKDLDVSELPVTFTSHVLDMGGFKVILKATTSSEPKVRAVAAETFRNLVQWVPWQCKLGHKLLEDWTSMGVLLNGLKTDTSPAPDDRFAQTALVELSIALGILFAQSPYTRSTVSQELLGFPAWLPTLRSAVITNLNHPALEYYSGIDITDITGHPITSLQGIQWNQTPGGPPQPKKASLRNIFIEQEKRVAGEMSATNMPPPSTSYDDPEVMKQKSMRLAYVILAYSIHLALSVQGGSVQHASVPPPSQPVSAPLQYPSNTPVMEPPAYQPAYPPPGHLPNPPAPAPSVYSNPPQAHAATPVMHTRSSMLREQGTRDERFHQSLMKGGYQEPPVPPMPPVQQQHQGYPGMYPPPQGQPPQYPPHGSLMNDTLPSQILPAQQLSFANPPSTVSRQYDAPPYQQQAPRYDPMFPTAGRPPSPSASHVSRQHPYPQAPHSTRAPASARLPPQQDPELQQTYSKFDNALKLTIHFAQYFNRKVDKKPTYKATPDGYMIRQTHIANPWTPVIKKNRLKSWSVKDLKEGDLFYFAIPFNELTIAAVEEEIRKARRHLTNVKKMFVITPQKAKGRRWFLFDVMNNIIPRVQDVLLELVKLLQRHGEENTKFPLFMFREQEMQEGERTIHPGNLLDVVDQVKFYFSQSPNDLAGVSSNYIKDLDERMKALASREFTGYEDDLSSDSSTISSDDSPVLPKGVTSTSSHLPSASGGGPSVAFKDPYPQPQFAAAGADSDDSDDSD